MTGVSKQEFETRLKTLHREVLTKLQSVRDRLDSVSRRLASVEDELGERLR